MRLATANSYDSTLNSLNQRQKALADLQEKISAGKQVVRPSDNPIAAALAERAQTRIDRLHSDQRALANQRNSIAQAESSLGDTVTLLQNARQLMLNAGNASYSATDRASLVQQLADIKDQLLALANTQDSNGLPVFSGLGSSGAPFVQTSTGVQFTGLNGETASTAQSLPGSMNGQAIWMAVPSGNGVFNVSAAAGNTGQAWSDAGQVTNPTALTGHGYQISFAVSAGNTVYSVTDTTTGTPVSSNTPYVAGQSIAFDGLSLKVQGSPQPGDSLQLSPSGRTDIFSLLDNTIQGLGSTSAATRMQTLQRSLTELDAGLDRVQSARGQAGNWLNRADAIGTDQEQRGVQLEADRSRVEDLDMVKGLSDLQTQQTGYEAALKSYAQVQRLSLFNFIN